VLKLPETKKTLADLALAQYPATSASAIPNISVEGPLWTFLFAVFKNTPWHLDFL
jgi:hypothetical protein